MVQGLIGKKIDQTQMFRQDGRRIPVTEIAVTDNAIVAIRTEEKNKYTAVQLGFGERRKANKSLTGVAKKAGFPLAHQVLQEIRTNAADELPNVGESVSVDTVFKAGDRVTVSGTSKGKGFAGVVKRHGFRGGPKTHGQSDRHRAPGSIGQTTTPGRVYRGKRMAGRMGSDTVTLANLTVVGVDAENKKLYVAGLVPGFKNAIVFITRVGENKKFVPLLNPFEKVEEPAAADVVEEKQEEAGIKSQESGEEKKAASGAVEAEVSNATSTSNVAAIDVAKEDSKAEAKPDVADTKEEK